VTGLTEDNEMFESTQMDTNPSTLDLPIFTEEFLDHNKLREQELRQLRKLNTEYEEQNAILSKHIDNMKSAIEKLEVESVQQKNNNSALNQHLTHLRTILSRSFAGIAIPGSNETPNLDNIDHYMIKLHSKLTKEKNRENEALFERVRGIVSGLDYSLH
jgi:predicted RNase H-like nuclease (RuvC/YqgF family)